MDHGEARIFMVEAPVVAAADPFDPEGSTADLASHRAPAPMPPLSDPLVAGPGSAHWWRRSGAVLVRNRVRLLPVTALAALPMHFFVGRVDDTVVAAPALVEMAGGFGLLLLPIMWLAFFTVSALPLVIGLAGTVGVAVPTAADGVAPRLGRVWSLVAERLRALWLWFAAIALLIAGLPLLITEERLGPGAAAPLWVVHAIGSTVLLTFGGVLGCVVLVERGHPRRAARLLSRVQPAGLIAASAAVTVVPEVVDRLAGAIASTAVAVVLVQLWAIAALVSYAQARRLAEPVTSGSLRAELSAPEE
ncbi:hypothetical protein [Actinoplanes solisilvae]|uniref:hypothetical protein n=1 Tax=Actinoplanes solisilvae TaxID=2486853 RepID=UPI000FD77B5B|nr:hypothetical protein [Actinoplanes solisilvae]